jgi:import inner membrane translocase subunit TIM50
LDKDTYLKDLEYLNRDLSKVLVVETDMRRLATHPENGMKLEPWMGTKGDHELEKLGKTLQGIKLLTRNCIMGEWKQSQRFEIAIE